MTDTGDKLGAAAQFADAHNLPLRPRPHTLRLRRLGIDTHQELVGVAQVRGDL
ncbi:MAG: hypothetical protein ACOY17_04970 [Pseudomonadota bacterium]